MGTWDVGPFDNDTAADFCASVDEADADARMGIIRDSLVRAADVTGYLDADISQEAVAAAALICAQCPGGDPADAHGAPKLSLGDLTSLRAVAVHALDRVVSEPSELAELWGNSEGCPWRASVDRLRQRLLMEPPGENLEVG